MHSLIRPFRDNSVEVVSEPSVLAETAAAHLQDDLSSRRRFASNLTIIYSPCDLLCLDEKCSLNKITSRIVLRKERSQTPTVLVNDNSKVQLFKNHTERREQL